MKSSLVSGVSKTTTQMGGIAKKHRLSSGFYSKLLEGLKKHSLTVEKVQEEGWKYCGGSSRQKMRYFRKLFPEKPIPKQTSTCVCGHPIKENCYITNNKSIITVGNCCVFGFIPEPEGKSKKTCSECFSPHTNRNVDRCNDCRAGKCDKCDYPCPEKYTICFACKTGKIPGVCEDCNRTCKKPYTLCFPCKYGISHELSPSGFNRCRLCKKACKAPYKSCYECKYS
jgi:hypothetical protein